MMYTHISRQMEVNQFNLLGADLLIILNIYTHTHIYFYIVRIILLFLIMIITYYFGFSKEQKVTKTKRHFN